MLGERRTGCAVVIRGREFLCGQAEGRAKGGRAADGRQAYERRGALDGIGAGLLLLVLLILLRWVLLLLVVLLVLRLVLLWVMLRRMLRVSRKRVIGRWRLLPVVLVLRVCSHGHGLVALKDREAAC